LRPLSLPGAIVYAGPAYLRELERLHGRTILVDCGDRAGDVLACLRTGLRDLLFRGDPQLHLRLVSIAGQQGGRVQERLDLPLIETAADDLLAVCCRRWLRAAPDDVAAV
jgi:hypothetical protein